MALIDKASLLMVPSTYEDGTLYNVLPSGNKAPDETGSHNGYDQTRADFTFSRGSNLAATRVNADGLIEKGRENLLTYSNDFSQWTKAGITTSSGQSGYDGSTDAWLVTKNGNAFDQLLRNVSSSGVATISLYAKSGTLNLVSFRGQGSTSPQATFNLDDGTISGETGGIIESKATSVGGGWWRLSIAFSQTITNVTIYPNFGGTTAGTIYIQDAQLEKGLVATDYIETGSSTAQAGILEDMPRINYDANGENGALLLEPSRSNLVPFGNYFDGTGWSKNGSITTTINTSGTKSPEGVYNATLLTSANATSEQQMLISSLSTTSGTSYAFSVFAKKKDYDFIHLRFQGSGSAFAAGSVWFNISSGTVGYEDSGKTGYIEDYGNGWYRCTAVATATATSSGAACRVQLASSDNTASVVGDGVKGTYVFGCQLEAGSYPSSLIPTHGAAVTRGADDAESDNISDLIGQTEGTFLIDAEVIAHNGDWIGIYPSSGSAYQNGFLVGYFSGAIRAQLYAGGTAYVYTQSTTNEKRYKIAITYTSSSYKVFIDGVKVHDVSKSTSFAVSLDRLAITGTNLTGKKGNVKHKEILMFPTALTDAECVTLTTL